MGGHRWAFCVTLLVLCGSTIAADDWPVARGPSREPAPYRYDATVWKSVPREFLEDTPACVLYAGTNYLVEPDGTVENIIHEITRLNGRKGIEALGEFRHITFYPAYEKLTLHEARIHKPDGRTFPVEPRHVHVRDVGTDYQVYDQGKQLIISFPSLDVGDVVEVKWTVRGRNPEHEGQFFTRYNFGDDTYPVLHDEMRVRLPKDKPLKYASIGGRLEPTVEEADSTRTYHWEVKNRRQLPQDDNLPSKEELRLRVAVSTFLSWEEVGRWKLRLRKECWECTLDVKKVVGDVTAGLKSPTEKARALTYWVKRNIRYLAAGETHDYTPHKPGAVLANRFGDCKDQSQLLAVMLREAGLSVSLVTLGVLGDGQVLESVPSPWGTHAILLVEIPRDGQVERHWIDTTTSLSAWNYLPRSDRDRLCYVIDDKGPLRLLRTPPFLAEDNSTEQTTHVSIGADGSSRCERTSTYFGSAAGGRREDWLEAPPGERRRLVADELQDNQGRARLRHLEVSDKELLDFEKPVRARMVWEVPDHFSGSPDREGSLSDGTLWGKLLSYNVDTDRTVPLELWQPFESFHRFVIDVPPGYRLDGTPRERSSTSKWGNFTLKVKTDPKNPRRLTLDMHTRLEKIRIEPADLEAFRKFQDEVSRGYRFWLTLKPSDSLDAAPLLDAVNVFAPEDVASATILARLYRDHEMTAEARAVLKRTLHYRPNDVDLWEMLVKVADTLEEEESIYREMVQRFPAMERFAVAQGGTLVNMGEHDKARKVLQPLADNSPSDAVRGLAWFHLARSSYRQNKFEDALKELEESKKADPDATSMTTALVFRGRIHEKLNQPTQARQVFRDVVAEEPEHREALVALVRLAWAAGDKTDALDNLRRYSLAVDGDAPGLATAADWHLTMGRLDDAFELATRSRELGFTEKAQRTLGLVHFRRGRHAEAVLHLSKADTDALVLECLIRSLLLIGEFTEAESRADLLPKVANAPQTLKRLCQRVKAMSERRKALLKDESWRDPLSALMCAEFAHEEGLAADRVESLLKKAEVDGELLGPALALRGLRFLERGRLDKAVADAEKALKLGPPDARAYLVRGRVRLERGQDGALADLEKAVELSRRKDAVALHWLAAGLFRAGRKDDALTTQREAVKLRPNDAELKEQLHEFEAAAEK